MARMISSSSRSIAVMSEGASGGEALFMAAPAQWRQLAVGAVDIGQDLRYRDQRISRNFRVELDHREQFRKVGVFAHLDAGGEGHLQDLFGDPSLTARHHARQRRAVQLVLESYGDRLTRLRGTAGGWVRTVLIWIGHGNSAERRHRTSEWCGSET